MSEPIRIDNTNRENYPVRLQRLAHARLVTSSFFLAELALFVRELQRSRGELGFNWLIILGHRDCRFSPSSCFGGLSLSSLTKPGC